MTPAEAVAAEAVETNPLYARDVDGDGHPESWCNLFLENVCARVGCPLPPGLRANQQVAWLASDEAKAKGWEEVPRHAAESAADVGLLAVAGWMNPDATKSGHVGVHKPRRRFAQAGASRFSDGTLERGFGALPTRHFVNARLVCR